MPSRGNYRPEYNQDARYDKYQQYESRYTKNDYKQKNQRRPDPPPQYGPAYGGYVYNGFDQGRYPQQGGPPPLTGGSYQQPPHSVNFNAPPPQYPAPAQRETFSTVQQSKNKTKVCMLIILIILLAAATALGGVSTKMTPWWKHSKDTQDYDWVHVGLWEACSRSTKDADWNCHTFNDTAAYKSYDHMELMQILMIAGTACSGLTFIFTFVAVFARNTRMFRALLYTIAFLSAASAALFGTVIGYVTDEKSSIVLLPTIIRGTTDFGNLDFALMFFLACAAAGTVFLALVFAIVILFITDDFDLDDLEDELDDTDYPLRSQSLPMENGIYPGRDMYPDERYAQQIPPPLQQSQAVRPHQYGHGQMYPPKQPQYEEEIPRKSKHKPPSDRYGNAAYRNPAFNDGYQQHPAHGPAVISKEYDPFPPTSRRQDFSNNPYKAYSVHSVRPPSKPHRSNRDSRQVNSRSLGRQHQQQIPYDDYEVYFNSPY